MSHRVKRYDQSRQDRVDDRKPGHKQDEECRDNQKPHRAVSQNLGLFPRRAPQVDQVKERRDSEAKEGRSQKEPERDFQRWRGIVQVLEDRPPRDIGDESRRDCGRGFLKDPENHPATGGPNQRALLCAVRQRAVVTPCGFAEGHAGRAVQGAGFIALQGACRPGGRVDVQS
jgi:hypothetical protein